MSYEIELLAQGLPGLAFEVLRRSAIARVEADQPVRWYEDGHGMYAEPCDSKYTGAWRVRGNNWEGYRPKARVLEMIAAAEAFPLQGDT